VKKGDTGSDEGRTMSKKGKCFFSFMISDSSFHCACVGSTPVGWTKVKVSVSIGYRHDQSECILTL
jgi:hypothetical protein